MSAFYELSDRLVLTPEAEVSMKDYEGKVLLIFNAAAL